MSEIYEQQVNLLAIDTYMPYFVLKAVIFLFANALSSLAKVKLRIERFAGTCYYVEGYKFNAPESKDKAVFSLYVKNHCNFCL